MSYGLISGSEASFLFSITKSPTQSTTTKSNPQNCSNIISNPNLVIKPSISIRPRSGSNRVKTRAAIVCGAAQATESLYELLGVSERGTPSEIKKAYKKLALKYHPDVSPPGQAAECTRRFIRVQEAYQTLSDPKTRALYDYDRDLGTDLHLGSSRRRSHRDQKYEEWGDWRDLWQSQLMELQRRSASRHSSMREKVTWGGAPNPTGSSQRNHRFYHHGFN